MYYVIFVCDKSNSATDISPIHSIKCDFYLSTSITIFLARLIQNLYN